MLRFDEKLNSLLEKIPEKELHCVISILDTNTYQVLMRSSPQVQDFVCGLYIRAARLNHSCKPNTRPVFTADRSMNVMATDDIAKGQEITTSYLEPFYTTLQRRAILKRGKAFDCDCPRCSDPTEFGSYSSGIRCSSCRQGWALSTNPLDMTSSWQCSNCQLCLGVNDVIALDNKLVEELRRVNKEKVANLEKFHKAYEPYLHPTHAFLMQLKQWMFEAYGKLLQVANFEKALNDSQLREEIGNYIKRKITLGEELLQVFDKLEGKLSFIRGTFNCCCVKS